MTDIVHSPEFQAAYKNYNDLQSELWDSKVSDEWYNTSNLEIMVSEAKAIVEGMIKPRYFELESKVSSQEPMTKEEKSELLLIGSILINL